METFSLFLQFLYAGHLECSSLPADQLVDLLVLVDHYGVDNLKLIVESALDPHVDDESVIPLLTVAHHCNASHLKDICLQHCALRRINLDSDAVLQLPIDLQQQLVTSVNTMRKWGVGGSGVGEGDAMLGDSGGMTSSGLHHSQQPHHHMSRRYHDDWNDSNSSVDPLVDDDSSTLLLPGLQDDRVSGRSSSRSSLEDPSHW